jgi:hypothetical protein
VTGSGLSGFVLGVWVYQETNSPTLYALSAVCASLPTLLLLPFAGVLADRWDRRRTMILCNLLASLTTLAIAVLLLDARLRVWHIYLGVTILSATGTFITLVQATTIAVLVPREHFGRSSGINQTIQAAQVLPPLLAGILIASIQIHGVILLDFASYLFAIGTLLFARIPSTAPADAGAAGKRPWLREATSGWNYVRSRPGLLALTGYFAVVNFIMGIVRVLLLPMILSFTTTAVLGVIVSAAGLGLLLGGVVMGIWGGPKNRVRGLLSFGSLFGVSLLLAGARASATLVGIASFWMYFFTSLVNGCSQAIWVSKTPAEIQGRVFALRWMVASSGYPLAYLLAGPLAGKVFEPLVASSETLSGALGGGAASG